MISFELGVEDLAATRFAMSPLHETLLSLRVLREPGLSALHLPWRRRTLSLIGSLDVELLLASVARRRTIADFLTPRPNSFAPDFEEQLAEVGRVPPGRVRQDLRASFAPDPLPDVLRAAAEADDATVVRLRDQLCAILRQYWLSALAPSWREMSLLLQADMTYRARRLALGGAHLLFSDLHPHVRWDEGVLHIDRMIGEHRVGVAGRGLLLLPSVFAHQPAPPHTPQEPPHLVYPSRGTATLWAAPRDSDTAELAALLGAPKARLLVLLEEPHATVDIARLLRITPSAVSQHLRTLHSAGLLTRARDGRQVLYRRSDLGDRLAHGSS
ncbi:ArsR/SmtB family transcription factor [Streptomyces sp. NPDC091272]|uniref:ArsR/SmtB family transcription factor n=1 Tax=Streptomyces sp. NPDC091272 TaxID=3365981 RepID=UPI003803607C